MNNKTPKGNIITKSGIKFIAFLLFIVGIALIFVLIVGFWSELSWKGWLLISIFILGYIFALTNLKKISTYSNGIFIKNLISRKTKFYSYDDIINYKFVIKNESFIRMQQLMIFTKKGKIEISSLLYKNMDKIYEQIALNCIEKTNPN